MSRQIPIKKLFFLLPALLFLVLAPFTPYLDLTLSGFFYHPGEGFYDNVFFHALFVYGELFGLATGALATLLLLLSFLIPKYRKWRRVLSALVLTLVIGAGMVTNWGFKGHWGRPRPKQIAQFGGDKSYSPFWRPNFSQDRKTQKSFPSGHVAMGFYFISLTLAGSRQKSKTLFWIGASLAALLGCGLMVGRIAQGGHFFSDVLASFVIMYYIAHFIDHLVNFRLRLKNKSHI